MPADPLVTLQPPPPFPNPATGAPYPASIDWYGLPILVENTRYSARRGVDEAGERWESEMPDHYGEVFGTVASDGDALDVFVGRDPNATHVYVVAIAHPDGTFDEVKAMLNYPSRDAAMTAIRAAYDDSLNVLRVTDWTIPDFIARCRRGDVKGDWRHGRGSRRGFDAHDLRAKACQALGIPKDTDPAEVRRLAGEHLTKLRAEMAKSADGWQAIPGGHHGGERRPRPSGGWDYRYPDTSPGKPARPHKTDDGGTTWYHGTKGPIEGGRLRGDHTGMVYLAQDPDVSAYYGPNISKHTVRPKKVLDLGDDPYDTSELEDTLRSAGHEEAADHVKRQTAKDEDGVQTNGVFTMLRSPKVVDALLHAGYDGVSFADDHDEHWKPRVLAVLAGAVSAPKGTKPMAKTFGRVVVDSVRLRELLRARDRRVGAEQGTMFGPPTREQGLVARRVKIDGYHRKGHWVPPHYETRLVRADAPEVAETPAPAPTPVMDPGPLFAAVAARPPEPPAPPPEPPAAAEPPPEPAVEPVAEPALEPWQQERKTTLWFERKAEVPAKGDFVSTKDGPREVTSLKVEFVPSDADSLGAPGGMDKGYAARVTLAPVTADARKAHIERNAALLSAADRRNAVNDALVAVGRHHIGDAIPTSLAPAGTSYVLVDERLPQLKEELLHADDGSWWRLHNSSSYDDWRDSALQLDAEGGAIAKKAVEDLAITGTPRSVAADVDARRAAELTKLREAKAAQQAAKEAALRRQFETAPAAVEELRDWFPETDPRFEDGRWSLAALPELRDMIGWTQEGDRMVAPLYGTQGPYSGVAAHPGGTSYNPINGRTPQSGLTGTVVRHLVTKREEAARRAAEAADTAARNVELTKLKAERDANMTAWEDRLRPWVAKLNAERPDLDARYHEPEKGRPATVSFGPAVSERVLAQAPRAVNQLFGTIRDATGRMTLRVHDPNQVDKHPVTKEWRRWSAVGADQPAMDAALAALLAHKVDPPPAPRALAPPAASRAPIVAPAADDFTGSYGGGGSVRVSRSGNSWLVSGNTFPIKDDIKAHGARWDPDARAWRIPHERAVAAGEKLRSTLHRAPAFEQRPMRKSAPNGRIAKRVLVHAHTRVDGTHVPQHETTVYVHPDDDWFDDVEPHVSFEAEVYAHPHEHMAAYRADGSTMAVATPADTIAYFSSLPPEQVARFMRAGMASIADLPSAYCVMLATSTPEGAAQMKGGTITHNHPTGLCFSRDDLALAERLELREIRATGIYGTWSASARSSSPGDWRRLSLEFESAMRLARTGAMREMDGVVLAAGGNPNDGENAHGFDIHTFRAIIAKHEASTLGAWHWESGGSVALQPGPGQRGLGRHGGDGPGGVPAARPASAMMVKATFDQARFDELLRAKRASAASLEAAGQISLFGGHASPEHAGLVPKQVTVAAHTTSQGVHVPAHQATVYARAGEPVAKPEAPATTAVPSPTPAQPPATDPATPATHEYTALGEALAPHARSRGVGAHLHVERVATHRGHRAAVLSDGETAAVESPNGSIRVTRWIDDGASSGFAHLLDEDPDGNSPQWDLAAKLSRAPRMEAPPMFAAARALAAKDAAAEAAKRRR